LARMTADQELASFIGKYSPEVAAVAKAALVKMRKRLPGAVELVWDNYNALAIAFGSSQRLADVIFSIALYPRWVSLFFKDGATLADPERLLKGRGKVMRHIVLDGAATLDRPAVRKLMDQAQESARSPIDPKGKHRIVIKAISAKQRPRKRSRS
jgi:hypothetical protein